MPRLLLLELNEINFDYLGRYIRTGQLPAFADFLGRHGHTETTSETTDTHLEPWIQWVTAHTGKSFAEHGVFRLGDIVGTGLEQIWERLERQGYRVAAMSPMNADCRVRDPAFFVPDPWTPAEVKASPSMKRLHAAIAQAVNDNAESRITPRSAYELARATLGVMRSATAPTYVRLLADARRKPWARAMFLDLLLADLFAKTVARTKPDFASLFLNAGAHIQHHYLYSSAVYNGSSRNPEWYVAPCDDPVFDVYRLYDKILDRLRKQFPRARMMLATGLHQDPYPELLYYWRLRDHPSFLRRIGLDFDAVEPRMSRDFIIRFGSEAAATRAEQRLSLVRADDGKALFRVDNRGKSLFVELVYPSDIPADLGFVVGNEHHERLRDEVAFVAIKNGGHNGIGYFSDSGQRLTLADRFALTELPDRIMEAMKSSRLVALA